MALGRAIVRHPQVFLFDEPLSNLDAKLRVQMRVELKRIHDRLGTTAIYVTHDQVEAMTLGDHVVVMKDGWTAVGEPLSSTTRRRIASWPASKARQPWDPITVQLGRLKAPLGTERRRAIQVPAATTVRLHHYADTDVAMGIRPEDLGITSGNDPADLLRCGGRGGREPWLRDLAQRSGWSRHASSGSTTWTRARQHSDRLRLAVDPDRLRGFDLVSDTAI